MATTDDDTLKVCRDQCYRYAVVILVTDQVVRIVQLEGKAEHRRDRRQCDVALVPVEPNADRLFAIPLAFANDTAVDQRGSIRAGLR